MKNVFLTGPRGVGKSTALRGALEALGLTTGGFFTRFGLDAAGEKERLLMLSAAGGGEETLALYNGGAFVVYPEAFNAFGAQCLAAPGAELLVMDELGRLERDALLFQAAVLRALDGPLPVLGVLREGAHGWLDGIRARPDVAVLRVDEQNRDGIPRQVLALMA